MKPQIFSKSLVLSLSIFGLINALILGRETSVKAEPQIYLETGGRESLRLDANTLDILNSIGLSLTPIVNTIEPAPGYSAGILLLPPSSQSSIRGTTFQFLYDDETGDYLPIQGTEEFAGDLVFNVDQNKLNLGSQLILGNFSNGFDANYSFSLTDTLTTGLKILNVESSGQPTVDINTQTWVLEGLNLNFSQEFSGYLTAAGATQSIAGLRFFEARGDRTFVPLSSSSQSIPESNSVLALGLIGIISVFVKKVH